MAPWQHRACSATPEHYDGRAPCAATEEAEGVSAALCAEEGKEPVEEDACRCACCRALWRRLEEETA